MVIAAAVWLGFVLAGAEPARPIPFEKNGQWGYKNAHGAVLIEPRFSIAGPFSSSGLAAVCGDDGWAYIDRSGSVVIRPFLFDNGPDDFQEGLARFTADGKFGFFDRRGSIVIKATFDFAARFSGGRAAVCQGCRKVYQGEHWSMEGGRWGYINRGGELLIPFRFDEAGNYERGRAKVKLAGAWIYIDQKGAILGRRPRGSR
ncbi:MAG: WG repeat-containing protein [Acidobacteria bacterium]|nr:WG repeat-containing protein [Acidobacteriota bacterium]